MTSKGRLAYAHARIRARKGQLLGTREAALLLAAGDPPSALAALGGDPFEKLLRIYELAIRTYRAPIFRALLGLHEIENVKLLWRVAANDRDRAAIRRLWLPLGALATVPMPRDVLSLRDVVEHLAKTPYEAIAKKALAVTPSVSEGPGRVEEATSAADSRRPPDQAPRSARGDIAFDRWARQRVLDEAKRLPKREAVTRQMIESGRVHRRAFAGNPFLLAPAVAVVLLAEAEVRAVRAIVERAGDATLDDVALRVVAQSRMGGG